MALDQKQRPPNFVIEARIADAIQAHTKENKLPCAQAFAIAEALGAHYLLIGQTADALEIHLSHCQLGLFGYPSGKGWVATKLAERPTPEGLEQAIREATDQDGNLACARAWEIAAHFRIPKMQVGYVADKLGIHIAPCQLGAF